jgi:hypothetical protein
MRRWQRALLAELRGRFEDPRQYIDRRFEHVNKKLNFLRSNQMATQADIDALTRSSRTSAPPSQQTTAPFRPSLPVSHLREWT